MASAAPTGSTTRSINLLSWNIQKFGESKLKDQAFLDYVCWVIYANGADVVGIMELVGWKGNEIRDALVTNLNNWEQFRGHQTKWVGAVSEMTPSRPNEQYLFLWKEHLFKDVKTVLWNVIGENDFAPIFTKDPFSWSEAEQEKFWAALYHSGYIDAAYMMVDSRRKELVQNPGSLSLNYKGVSVPLTPPQTDAIVKILLAEQTMGFPSRHSRPPFLLRATTADTNTNLFIMLFHAPGPGSDFPLFASNQLSFVQDVAAATAKKSVGVVMGDFNLDRVKSSSLYSLSYFSSEGFKWTLDATGKHIPCVAFQRLIGPSLVPPGSETDLTRVLDYVQVIPGKTSITTTVPDAATPSTADSFQNLLCSEYDRFFVRSPGANPSGGVVPLIAAMIAGHTGIDQTAEAYLSAYATEAYNNWVDRQKSKKFGRNNIGPVVNGPANVREAHQVYRNAISDHLPISMNFIFA